MEDHRDTAHRRSSSEFLAAIAPYRSAKLYSRAMSICLPGDPVEYWYRVESGIAARRADPLYGRRHIVELLLPGDFFGFSASGVHLYAIEAMADDTEISCYPRPSVEALAESNPKLEKNLRRIAFEAISRLDDRVVTVGRKSAVEKVGAFLIEMAERAPHGSGDRLLLPLSRYDIADYLGLSMEAVSRSISALRRRAAISLVGPHRIELLDRRILRAEGAGSGQSSPGS